MFLNSLSWFVWEENILYKEIIGDINYNLEEIKQYQKSKPNDIEFLL